MQEGQTSLHVLRMRTIRAFKVEIGSRGPKKEISPRRATDPPAKERERLRETRTRRAEASLRGTPGPIVSSSVVSAVQERDQRPAETGLGQTSRTGDAATGFYYLHLHIYYSSKQKLFHLLQPIHNLLHSLKSLL